MKISPATRLHQARLQVLRARDRLRSGASGIASAQAFLDQALSQLDALAYPEQLRADADAEEAKRG